MQDSSKAYRELIEENALLKQKIRELERSESDCIRTEDERLHASELPYEMLFANAPEGILVADVRTRHLIHVNPALCRMFGYTEKEMLRLGVENIHPEGVLERTLAEFDASGRGEKTSIPAFPCRRKDGSLFYADINTTPIVLDDGECNVLAFFTDVTERRQTEESLLLFKALVDHSTDAIGIATPEGRHYYQNEAFDRLFGDRRENSPESLYVDKAVVKQFVGCVMAGGSWQGEVKMFKKDGAILDVFFRTYAIRNQDDRIIGLVGLHTDIAENKRAEEALRASEEKFIKAFNANPGMISISTFAEGRFLEVNECFLQTLGFSREEVIGRTSVDLGLITAELRAAQIREFEKTGPMRDHPSPIRTKTGEIRECLVSSESIEIGGRKLLLLLMNDITERRRAEENLRDWMRRYELVVAASGQVAYECQLAMGDIRWGASIEKVLGFTVEEMNGGFSQWADLLHPKDREAIIASYNAAMRDAAHWDVQYRMRHKRGDYVWIRDRGFFIPDSKGRICSQLGMMEDITENKRAEEALRASEEKFIKAFNANPGIMAISTLEEGRFLEVNEYFMQSLGFLREEVVGRSSVELGILSPETRKALRDAFLQNGCLRNYPMPLRTKTGEIRDCLVSGEIIDIAGQKHFLILMNDITERKCAEEELQAWKRRYDLVVAASGQVAYEYTVSTGEIAWGASTEKVNGFTLEEMNGGLSQWQSMLHPEERDTIMAALNAAMEKVAGWDVEYRLRHKRGNYVWVRDRGFFLPDSSGRAYCQLGMMEDITERKLAAEELRDREQLLSQIINNMPGRVARIDRDLRYIFANREYERTYGISLQNIIGHTVTEVYGEEQYRYLLPYIKRVLDGELVTFEGQTERNTGGIAYSLFRLIPDVGSDETVRGFFVVALDITERKQVEETLRESQVKLMEAQRLAHIGHWEIDLLTNRTTWSEETYRIFEKDSKRFTPSYEAFLNAIHPEDREAISAAYEQALESHQPYKFTHRLLFPDGRIKYLHDQGETYYGSDGKPQRIVGIVQDITELKQAEEEKNNLAMQLTQSQKMESVGRLAGGVAHDFNNMLSVIIGSAQLAMGKITPDHPLYKSLKDILNAGMRSAELTRQLLAFARKQTINPKVLDLNDTLVGMHKILQRLIGENIKLVWVPGPNLWHVRIDPSQVDQLLANLAVNARDAIDKTGRIVIETSNATCDEAYRLRHPECVPGEYVLLSVSDDGCGMAKEILANIFEPFFTTKKEGQGTGLGLPTVYGIVKQNAGFINVYSEPELGTTFRIYLPRYEDKTPEVKEDSARHKIRGGTETVLIVEDEAVVLALSRDILETLGYKVLTARGADQALHLVKDYDGNIDLLLIDVVMPDMNGKELSERILSMKPGLKHLYMSGYTADIIARQGILEEGVQLISKPFSLDALAAKVREVLES